jgi:hypothetical protein
MDKFLELEYDEWQSGYSPIQNQVLPFGDERGYEGTLFETYGAELDYVIKVANLYPRTVWTLDDTGIICSGYHIVNRLGYFISLVPYRDNVCITVIDIDQQNCRFEMTQDLMQEIFNRWSLLEKVVAECIIDIPGYENYYEDQDEDIDFRKHKKVKIYLGFITDEALGFKDYVTSQYLHIASSFVGDSKQDECLFNQEYTNEQLGEIRKEIYELEYRFHFLLDVGGTVELDRNLVSGKMTHGYD